MLCQPPGAQTTLARTVTQGSRTAGKEFREILLAGQCLHLGHAPAWFISKNKKNSVQQRSAWLSRWSQCSIISEQCKAVLCIMAALCRLCCRRRCSSSVVALHTCSSRYVGGRLQVPKAIELSNGAQKGWSKAVESSRAGRSKIHHQCSSHYFHLSSSDSFFFILSSDSFDA